MRILFNDVIQNSDAPPELKSPALSEMFFPAGQTVVALDGRRPINAIGVGNTDGVNFSIAFNDAANTVFNFQFSENGLYAMPEAVLASRMQMTTDATHIGRLGAGLGARLPTAISKEPSFASTSEPRVTLSGQVVPGAGGYNYRALSLDCRYKITAEIMNEIKAGYLTASRGYPYFIDLTDEAYKLPFSRLYANEKNQRSMTFQSGARLYLYSKRFEFEERF